MQKNEKITEQEFNVILGDRLSKFLKYNKISQKKVAELLGVTPATVSMWLSGVNAMSTNIISTLMDELNIDYHYLMGRRQSEADTLSNKVIKELNNDKLAQRTKESYDYLSSIKRIMILNDMFLELEAYVRDLAYKDNVLEPNELELFISILELLRDKLIDKSELINENLKQKEQDQ